jgi:hypothetical protein
MRDARDRSDDDVQACIDHQVPIIITSLGARPDINAAGALKVISCSLPSDRSPIVYSEILGYQPETLEARARASASTYARYLANAPCLKSGPW